MNITPSVISGKKWVAFIILARKEQKHKKKPNQYIVTITFSMFLWQSRSVTIETQVGNIFLPVEFLPGHTFYRGKFCC